MWDGVDFFDRLERRFNDRISQLSTGFTSYKNRNGYNSDNIDNRTESYFTSNQRSERRLNDGSLLVINNSTSNENGQEIKNTETFILTKDGIKKNIDLDTAKLLLQN